MAKYGHGWSWGGALFRGAYRVVVENGTLFLLGALLALAGVALATPFDVRLLAWVTEPTDPELRQVAYQFSKWGELHLAPALLLMVVLFFGLRRRDGVRLWAVAAAACASLSSGLVVNVLKFVFGRPRPYTGLEDGLLFFETHFHFHSFPSGHATHCSAIAAALCFLLPRTAALAWGATLLILWARLYTLSHYPADLVGGLWLGSSFGLAFGLAARRLATSKTSA